MYADDSKIYGEATTQELRKQIQTDLDRLVDWAKKWQMNFNAGKCHVMHLGHNNLKEEYDMVETSGENRVKLEPTTEETDLGVIVDKDLTFTKHITSKVNKANRLVGLIRRSFSYLDKDSMRTLFTAIVRPHLEFGNVAWSPHHKKYINMIEKVQRRATKCVPGMKDKEYEERLREMNLPSLVKVDRRKRGDLIEVYLSIHMTTMMLTRI